MKSNRYIKAMEIGLANEENGISYLDLVEKLQSDLGYDFNGSAEATFMSWFDDNFESIRNVSYTSSSYTNGKDLYFKQKYGVIDEITDTVEQRYYNYFVSYRRNKFFLKGNAAKQYLDYQELQESRLAATQAKKQSNISIGIAIFALLVSSLLGVYSMMTAPVPPYDVKVIEDNSRAAQLERENGELKDELYKAEMMLEAYESDSDSVSGS